MLSPNLASCFNSATDYGQIQIFLDSIQYEFL